jgi:RNA polymerase sigma-70 factor, ECF subfamily
LKRVVVRQSPSLGVRSRLFVVRGEGDSQGPPLSDAELIDAFERGEGRACEDIYDRLIGVVETTLFRVFGGRDANHDDLVQSAFEQIVTTLVENRFARACSLASWAASVTTYVAFNAMRARTRERRVVDRSRDGDHEAERRHDASDPESEAHARAMLSLARLHLSQMSSDRATTVFLHDVLGHELAEVAVLTGVSISAAQSRLVRGRKELKRRLQKSRPWRGAP